MIINSILLIVLFSILLISPSYAGAGAPEIPAGFGPIIISGIVLTAIALKRFKEKN